MKKDVCIQISFNTKEVDLSSITYVPYILITIKKKKNTVPLTFFINNHVKLNDLQVFQQPMQPVVVGPDLHTMTQQWLKKSNIYHQTCK